MKRIFVAAGVVLAVLLVAGGGALFWAQGYLRGPAFRNELQKRVSAAAGAPVTFDSFHITFFRGIVARGVAVQDPSGAGGTLAGVREVRVTYNLGDLLAKRRVAFDRITLDTPVVTLRQDANGNLRLPTPPKNKAEEETPETKKDKPKDRKPDDGGPGPDEPLVEVVLDKFEIIKGSFDLADRKGRTIVRISDMNVSAKSDGAAEEVNAAGTARIGEIATGAGLRFTGFNAAFDARGNEVKVPSFTTGFCGGTIAGAGATSMGGDASWKVDAKFTDVDVAAIAKATGGNPDSVKGRLNGTASAGGSMAATKNLRAAGEATLSPVQFGAGSIVRGLAGFLGIRELSEGRFESVRATYSLQGSRVQLPSVRTEPRGNLQILASGWVDFNKTLAIDGTVEAGSAVLSAIPAVLSSVLKPGADGFVSIPFQVRGSTEKPQVSVQVPTDTLVDAAENLLDSFLGGGKKKDKEKKDKKDKERGGGSSVGDQLRGLLGQ